MSKTSKGKKYFVKTGRNMFNLDEDKVEFALATELWFFGRVRKPRILCILLFYVEIRCLYSLRLLVLPNSNN